VQQKLQKELDDALGAEDLTASTFEQVKRLTYLEAVINEALRIHSTSAIGLLVWSRRRTYNPRKHFLSIPS